jgi:hypothetical protein
LKMLQGEDTVPHSIMQSHPRRRRKAKVVYPDAYYWGVV